MQEKYSRLLEILPVIPTCFSHNNLVEFLEVNNFQDNV